MRSNSVSAALVGAAFAALVTLPGLGSGTLWDNSETAYGEVAREILLSGDPVVLHMNGAPWFVQPPLYFWVAAAFAHVLGPGTLAMRLPAALATIAAGALLGAAVGRIAGARAGIIASLCLSSCLIQAVIGRLAIMDAILDAAVMWAMLAALRAFMPGGAPGASYAHGGAGESRPARTAAFFAGALALALGILAKGLVALAIPLLVLVAWALWEWRLGRRLVLPAPALWAAGVVLVLALVVPWFALLAARSGAGGVGELIVHYTLGRYVGTIENQTGPVWFYLPVVLLGFFPWTAFLFPALAQSGFADADERGSLRRLGACWIVVSLVFFSFAQTKLPNYLALAFPALAILTGLWFDRVASGRGGRGAVVAAAFLPLSGGSIAIALAIFARTMRLGSDAAALGDDLRLLGGVLLAGSLVTFATVAVARLRALAPYSLAATSLAFFMTIALVAVPHAEALKPVPRLAALVRVERRPTDAVAIMGVPGGNALLFYTQPRVDTLALPGTIPSNGAKDAREVICGASRALVVTSRIPPATPWGRRATILVVDGKDALVRYDGPPCRPVRP